MLVMAMTAGFNASKNSDGPAYHAAPNGFVGGGSPEFHPKRTKYKGWMREHRRTDRGHGYNKHRIHASR